MLDRFRAAMDDDLDTPEAMALLFDTVRTRQCRDRRRRRLRQQRLAATVREMCVALGSGPPRVPPTCPRGRGQGGRARRGARREGLRPPTRCAPSSRPTAGPSRPRRTARRSGGSAARSLQDDQGGDRPGPAVQRREGFADDGADRRVGAGSHRVAGDGCRHQQIAGAIGPFSALTLTGITPTTASGTWPVGSLPTGCPPKNSDPVESVDTVRSGGKWRGRPTTWLLRW